MSAVYPPERVLRACTAPEITASGTSLTSLSAGQQASDAVKATSGKSHWPRGHLTPA